MSPPSLVGWLLNGFPPHARSALMLNVVLNRPAPYRDNFTSIPDFRDEFADYWEELFGSPAPLAEVALSLTIFPSPVTSTYFRALVEAIDQTEVDNALQSLAAHLNARVDLLQRYETN